MKCEIFGRAFWKFIILIIELYTEFSFFVKVSNLKECRVYLKTNIYIYNIFMVQLYVVDGNIFVIVWMDEYISFLFLLVNTSSDL